ncbi:uncharacterized protein BO80DRAFT_206788 [Aspergillus ibericus CBS 121593]|uniref:Uncharacterized protein n=1 Tax=Aspergillus ibericus CBS 121593 TaxID=1448316 RepID=A0A395HAI2_9EURO|nr:hypothetical protein BO80DRAFT_206788 [Aspergillus ibericus CBS 121593]RAL04700.1 hypothetical protein BO80DRAFT_206788 [Aspergillus ibericus CBS 121593]
MASLANLGASPLLQHAAYEKYTSVLRDVRLALADHNHTVSDQILVTVMLLNLFDTVTSDAISLTWNQHERGELALVHVWSLDPLQSSTGWNIFQRLRTDVLSPRKKTHSNHDDQVDALAQYISEVQSIDEELETWSAEYTNKHTPALSLINTRNLTAPRPYSTFPVQSAIINIPQSRSGHLLLRHQKQHQQHSAPVFQSSMHSSGISKGVSGLDVDWL